MRHRRLMPFALVACLLFTACPKASQSQIDKAAKYSGTIASRYVETVDLVSAMYSSGAISLELKDKIADGLIVFGKAGVKLNALIAAYAAQYKDGSIPASVWGDIQKNFDVLSKEFLFVLSFIPQASSLSSSKAFRAISAAILALATTLSETGMDVHLRELQEGIHRNGLDVTA